jgi:hypothetical protein
MTFFPVARFWQRPRSTDAGMNDETKEKGISFTQKGGGKGEIRKEQSEKGLAATVRTKIKPTKKERKKGEKQ